MKQDINHTTIRKDNATLRVNETAAQGSNNHEPNRDKPQDRQRDTKNTPSK